MRELDCEQVLELVWEYLDGEMEETRVVEIRTHVDGCFECGRRYDFQRRLMILIEQKCREGPVPAAVRERLFRLLEE
jgi:mycothiol system anti-sigma-R factor